MGIKPDPSNPKTCILHIELSRALPEHFANSVRMGPKGKGKGRGKKTTEAVQVATDEEAVHTGEEGDAREERPDQEEETDSVQADTEDQHKTGDDGCKRKKVPESLTPEQEQALADWFADEPMFYDQTHADFKDRGKRDRKLAEKGQLFGLSGEHIIK